MTTPADNEALREEIGKTLTELENIVESTTVARMNGRTTSNRMVHAEFMTKVFDLITHHTQATEKAYGGCHNCYGKGYATVNDRWVGRDTDQDIGSRGGTVRGGNESAMKFCSCARGQQLKQRMQAAEAAARIDEASHYCDDGHFHDWERDTGMLPSERLAELKAARKETNHEG